MHYRLIENGKRGELLSQHVFETPVVGYEAEMPGVSLLKSGTLIMDALLRWDFGTGAIDTPAVVEASLKHDAFCWLTDAGLIPWECREAADADYRDTLKSLGVGFVRRWAHWLVVRGNSKFNAYWKRKR